MEPDKLFTIAGDVAMAGWLLLAVLPRWRWTTTIITSFLLPGTLAVLYVWLIVRGLGEVNEGLGAFGSLAGVKSLFQNDVLLLAGWVHYLAFDLFIGSWEVRDSQRLGISQFWVLPCLFLTLMLGPGGLLLYFAIRAGVGRQWLIEEPHSHAPHVG